MRAGQVVTSYDLVYGWSSISENIIMDRDRIRWTVVEMAENRENDGRLVSDG
jgi:hypothetical protein